MLTIPLSRAAFMERQVTCYETDGGLLIDTHGHGLIMGYVDEENEDRVCLLPCYGQVDRDVIETMIGMPIRIRELAPEVDICADLVLVDPPLTLTHDGVTMSKPSTELLAAIEAYEGHGSDSLGFHDDGNEPHDLSDPYGQVDPMASPAVSGAGPSAASQISLIEQLLTDAMGLGDEENAVIGMTPAEERVHDRLAIAESAGDETSDAHVAPAPSGPTLKHIHAAWPTLQ